MTGTERKALNKYYPPDFDPRKIPKVRGPRNRQYVIRVMAPFNMRCNTCAEYIYKGKKFNARRETVEEDDYLGLFLFRFYIRCPGCLAEITFKTDLKNCDYEAEHGSTRLFEADKALREMEKEKEKEEAEEMQNPMKQLEKRTKMSRFEMEALERLEELRDINQREGKIDYEGIIGQVTKNAHDELARQEQEDEEFVHQLFGEKDGKKVKRILDDDEDDLDTGPSTSFAGPSSSRQASLQTDRPPPLPFKKIRRELDQKKLLGGGIIVKKAQDSNITKVRGDPAKTSAAAEKPASAGLNLLGDYGNSSSGEESS